MSDDAFDTWLGRTGADRPVRLRMRVLVNRAGGRRPFVRSPFTGVKIGRGVGVAALLAASGNRAAGPGRRVIVKASIVRLGPKGFSKAVSHLRYLERDATTREGRRGALYGPEADTVGRKAFLDRGADDRHQFRFIVAPEDGDQYEDLKPLIRRWMGDVEQDLGTRLDWVAVDHFDTGHPHAHVIVRGKDERGADLVIAHNYITHGLRERACRLVDLDLGPRTAEEQLLAARREIEAERLTDIDRRLIASIDADGLVRARHAEPVEQSLRAGRLRALGQMGLAVETAPGDWRLEDGLEAKLKLMGVRGDIIRTMQRAVSRDAPERSPADFAIYDPGHEAAAPVIGRVIARGVSDEHADHRYLIVDAVDGLSHYIDVGTEPVPMATNSIVRVTPARIEPRAVDRSIAEIAAANDGRYSVERHLRHDPQASEALAEAHVRRLERIRRAANAVEREDEGSWKIRPDYLARVEAYEQDRAQQRPVEVEMLSAHPLAELPRRDRVTWLDRELVAGQPTPLGRGFGAEVRQALALRLDWLLEAGLAQADRAGVRLAPDLLAQLHRRELRQVAMLLSDELGRSFIEARHGERIEGICRRAVMVGDESCAVIEHERSFTLVPWRPALERAIGKPIAGIVRERGISWSVERAGPTIGR